MVPVAVIGSPPPLLVTVYFSLMQRNPIGGTFIGAVIGLLQDAPGLKLLVTSHERLHLHGEWIVALEGRGRWPRT
jgi:hypothetical protein